MEQCNRPSNEGQRDFRESSSGELYISGPEILVDIPSGAHEPQELGQYTTSY